MTDEKRIEDGGPAFPCDSLYDENLERTDQGSNGASLRDYFAAKAMQAMVPRDDYNEDEVARFAYAYADAMLAIRSLKP